MTDSYLAFFVGGPLDRTSQTMPDDRSRVFTHTFEPPRLSAGAGESAWVKYSTHAYDLTYSEKLGNIVSGTFAWLYYRYVGLVDTHEMTH